MTVEVTHFDIAAAPTSQRPRIAEYRTREGELSVHCSREDGSLWLFATGPAGGERGQLTLSVERAMEVQAWLADDTEGLWGGGGFWIRRRVAGNGQVRLVVSRTGWMRTWHMTFEPEALEDFRTCLAEWAAAVLRAAGLSEAPSPTGEAGS